MPKTTIIIVLLASLSTSVFADTLDQLLPSAEAMLGDNPNSIIPVMPESLVPNTPDVMDLTYPVDPKKPDCVFPVPSDEVNPADFVNLCLEDAINLAEANGKTYRLKRVDGEYYMVTADYRLDRLNFEVDEGIVTSCTKG